MSSTEEVKSTSTSGFSENVIRKNSSCGLAVRKNSTTASRDLRSVNQLALDVFDGGSEIDQHLGFFRERDQEKLILRIGRAEEFHHRLARLVDLVAHGSAVVEDNAQRNGSVFAGEVLDLLRLPIIGKLEILLLQPCYQPVHRICN